MTEGGEQEDELASKTVPEAAEAAEVVVATPEAAFMLLVGERVTSSRSEGNAPSHQEELTSEAAAEGVWPPPLWFCWSRLQITDA